MSTSTQKCDQAIFTSIRTPTGEGYRIVAASRGLRPDEKQVITRLSPSHDALCWDAKSEDESGDRFGVSFFPLPGARFCVAYSCYAGAEHTGRGGHRVYTHNVIFDRADLARWGFNPFAVIRAMKTAELTHPQLKPSPVLPECELPITEAAGDASHAAINPALCGPWRGYVLHALLRDESLVINVTDGWVASGEALVLALPGPMREKMSFSGGLRFSVGRRHRLSLLHDHQGVTKSRMAGRPLLYVNPSESAPTEPPQQPSSWATFVERHWAAGDCETLARRTSKAFSDATPAGYERIGQLYNAIDTVDDKDVAPLLALTGEHLCEHNENVEAEIVTELAAAALGSLLRRLPAMPWQEVHRYWHALCDLRRHSTQSRRFAEPLMEKALEAATAEQPCAAAEAALALTRDLPRDSDDCESEAVLQRVLNRFAEWADRAPDTELRALANVWHKWRAARPDCPIVKRVHERCQAMTVSTATGG